MNGAVIMVWPTGRMIFAIEYVDEMHMYAKLSHMQNSHLHESNLVDLRKAEREGEKVGWLEGWVSSSVYGHMVESSSALLTTDCHSRPEFFW